MLTPIVRNAEWVTRSRSGCSGICARPATTRPSRLALGGVCVCRGSLRVAAGLSQDATGRAAPDGRGLSWRAAAVLAVGFYTASRPTHLRSSNFWTSSPTYFAVRVGVLMAGAGVLFA